MPQIALISHVSFLKFKDEEARSKHDEQTGGRKKHFINTNNAQAAAMIMAGMAG